MDTSNAGVLNAADLLPYAKFNFPDHDATLEHAQALLEKFDHTKHGCLNLDDFQSMFFGGNLRSEPSCLQEMLQGLLDFVNSNSNN